MDNRVGASPDAALVSDALAKLDGIEKDFESFTASLTNEERQAVLKFRPGGEPIVDLVAKLGTKYGLKLPSVTVEDMVNDLALAKATAPLTSRSRRIAQRFEDTELTARSESWQALTAFYSILLRMSMTDAQLADDLRPAVDFFAVGPRKKTV